MLEQARRSGDPAAAALLSRTIPDGPFAAEAALAAAGMESAAGRPRAAAAVLEALLVASPLHGDVLARALQSLAASYRALDEVPRERSVLRRMTTDCAGAKLPDGTPAAEFAARELASPRFQDAPAATPDPRPPFRVVHETMEAAAPRPVPVLGRAPRGAEDAVLLAGEGIATLMSPDGQFRWRSLLDVEPRVVSGTREQFVFSGDDAASGRGARIAAIQAADGARLWSRRIPGQWHASHTAMGIAYVLVEDIDERGDKVTRLSAWSAETGDPLGERVLPATMSPVVAAAGDALVVYEQIRGSSGTAPRRRAIVLDAASLSPRGVVDLEQWDSSFHVAVPGRSCLVTTAQLQSVTAIDTAGGVRAWGPVTFPGAQVKSVLAAPDGVFVADTKHRIHLLSGADGSIVWTRDLAPLGQLGIYGEAAEGDVYAATVLGPAQSDQATAVTLDAATGDIRWQQKLPLEGRVSRVIPVPRALRNVVAWELPERPAEALRNRIVLFDRATGRVAATIDHSRLSKSRFMAVYTGRCITLSDPAGGTVVYAGEPPQPQGR
ncbi:MAG: hypothetical protein HMLKMBBP_03570 [Planctomycetes bacterium]|nr:hypothetical protein [Planctomycetota bacterium]